MIRSARLAPRLLAALAAGALVLGAASADAQSRRTRAAPPPPPPPLDLNDPADVLIAMRKMACSTVDGEPVVYYWAGDAWSRRQGEADRLLWRAEGMNIRACVSVRDPVRGPGYRLVSRELLIYRDPTTGEILRTWTNPWTGETVDVLHVANDPVNSTTHVRTRTGEMLKWRGTISGDRWMTTSTIPLFYSNPLAGPYQAEIGGTYHATEMFNFSGPVADLLDRTKTGSRADVAWSRMSDWLPWMKMGGREGLIYFNTIGRRLDSWEQMPQPMRDEIAKSWPAWTAPPPLDDTRPNETSWTYFKAVREGTKTVPKRD